VSSAWIDSELWHGTWEGDESDLRRVDPRTARSWRGSEMPPGAGVSGLESDGAISSSAGRKQREVRAVAGPGEAPQRAVAPARFPLG